MRPEVGEVIAANGGYPAGVHERLPGRGGAFQKFAYDFENGNTPPCFTRIRCLLNPQMPVTLSVSDVPFSLRETPILT